MGLTQLLKQGKQAGMALLMAGSLSCANQLKPAKFQGKEDYQAYPKYKKDIALYNIWNILQENCNQGSKVDEIGFSCEYSTLSVQSTTIGGSSQYGSENHTDSVNWDEIQTTSIQQNDPNFSSLKVNGKSRLFYIRNDQVWIIKRAIDIYLQETRHKAPSDKPTYVP